MELRQVLQRMWLPGLTDALVSGRIDVAITCGLIPALEGMANEVFCAEPLLVGGWRTLPDHLHHREERPASRPDARG